MHKRIVPFCGYITVNDEEVICQILHRGNLGTRAERLRFYRRRLPGPEYPRKVRITDENIDALVKRGYLGPNERDDTQAI